MGLGRVKTRWKRLSGERAVGQLARFAGFEVFCFRSLCTLQFQGPRRDEGDYALITARSG